MLRRFVKFLILFFFLQALILFRLDYVNVAFVCLSTISFALMLFLVPNRHELNDYQVTKLEKFSVSILFSILSLYVLLWLKSNGSNVGMLNSHEDVGLVHKFCGVFIPGFLAYYRQQRLKLRLLVELVSWFLVLGMTFTTLSKHYLVSMIWGYIVTSKGLNWRNLIGIILMLVVFLEVYMQRGATSSSQIVDLLIRRFPIYFEGVESLKYYLENGLFPYYNVWQMSSRITEFVFLRNPIYMGWAPGLLGVYILYSGLAAMILLPLSLRVVHFVLIWVARIRHISFLSTIIFFDLISTLTDGLPHILTSVNKGRVFYGYLLLVTVYLFFNAIFSNVKKANSSESINIWR